MRDRHRHGNLFIQVGTRRWKKRTKRLERRIYSWLTKHDIDRDDVWAVLIRRDGSGVAHVYLRNHDGRFYLDRTGEDVARARVEVYRARKGETDE